MMFEDSWKKLPDSLSAALRFRCESCKLRSEKIAHIETISHGFLIFCTEIYEGMVIIGSELNYQVGRRRPLCRTAASNIVQNRVRSNDKRSEAQLRRNSGHLEYLRNENKRASSWDYKTRINIY